MREVSNLLVISNVSSLYRINSDNSSINNFYKLVSGAKEATARYVGQQSL